MKEFIQMATQKLGISEAVSTNATGGLLGAIKNAIPASDFTSLAGKVPGLADAVSKLGGGGGGGGGGAGGILGAAASMLGGKAGAVAGIAGALSKSGLGADKFGSFAGMLINYLKGKAGNEIVSKVLTSLPELKTMIG